MEKDWGTKFPKSYLWCQANSFKIKNSSFFLSIAEVPFKRMNFNGFICVLLIDGKEYRFATYNLARIKNIQMNNRESISLLIKKNKYELYINIKKKDGQKLIAPNANGMKKIINESLDSEVNVKLLKGNEVLFEGVSLNTGLEIVGG